MELRGRPLTQHRRRRGVHPSGLHRRHAGIHRARAGEIPVTAHEPCDGRRPDPRVRAAPAGTLRRATRMKAQVPDVSTALTLDPEQPWLGLSSYTEATRAYFHGRDEE